MSLLTRLSLANRAIAALISLLIVAIGVWATVSMKQELIPSIKEPAAVVVVTKSGSSPTTLDDQVVRPLAQALDAVTGIDKVTSATSNGSAQVSVTWAFGADGDKILADLNAATARFLGSASDGVTAQVIAGGADDIPVLLLALTNDGPLDTLADRVDAIVVPEIKKVPGVRDAEISGRVNKRMLVTLDPAALTAKSIEQPTVSGLLSTEGTVVPAGTSVDGSQSLAIEVGQEKTTVADIAAMPIPTLAGPVPLSQVATVELAPVDQSSLARFDGRPSIGLTITKNPDANAVQVSHAVRAAVDGKLSEIGDGAASHTIFDQSPMVEESIHNLSVEGGLGLIFAVLVILVFLLSPRATIITAISIPMSLLIAIIGLRLGGFSLNILTLAALTVAVGRVVDDSIVVIENIIRRRGSDGLTPESVRASVAEVAGAVTASTLTTVAVFLPVAFVSGIAGQLFRPFSVTVAIALLGSLIVSLTIVPVLAYWFMRKPTATRQLGEIKATALRAEITSASSGPNRPGPVLSGAERTTRLQRAYLPALGFALRRPVTMVLIAFLALGGTVLAAGSLKTDLLGSFSDARAVQIRQTMPLSSTLEASDAVALELEKTISAAENIESYQTTVGSQGAPVILDVVLAKGANVNGTLAGIRESVSRLPRAADIVVETQATETASTTIDTIVTGTDEVDLIRANDAIVATLEQIRGIDTVTTDLAAKQPVLKVAADRTAAAAQGFSVAEVGTAIAAAVEGETLGSVTVDGKTRDLVVRSRKTGSTAEEISNLPLPVSALQQQRVQKDATDALTREQDRITAKAGAEARRAADSQLAETVAARKQSASDLGALRSQLGSLISDPPPASPEPTTPIAPSPPDSGEPEPATPSDSDPLTVGEFAALQYAQAVAQHEQLIAQLTDSIAATQSGLIDLDKQIASARKGIVDGAAQQAESDRLGEAQREVEKLRATPILVRDVATVAVVNSPATITRIDGVRAITIAAKPAAGDLGAATAAVDRALATVDLPNTVSLAQGGAGEEQNASFSQLGLAMLIAIALVYIVLVATFRSLVQPLLLLISIPLAATGAIVGLLVTGTPLGIPAMIGMLMLIGIVVTNAIVLIDLVNLYRRQGYGVDEAVTHGARLRLRPIIMTACATIFALLPMALGLTGGSAFISKALAIVVIGGLVSSTVLTLLLLPSLYALYERGLLRRSAKGPEHRTRTARNGRKGQTALPAGQGARERLMP